ncbi:MAG: UDP-3-O-(3-hydroxymyristoyl)glucosamine N-acyltransferase [Tepidimonas sp.]|uniref:UDP-3-O-(3-hydroxymyristoyl)glucosamine N-acyltransferase n=1 Tax=Tepidimonas sp. TaxID=2002775 RepID=UPI00298EF6B8|nr:UDP-3-O-(3-hydroxymyristoyl)glucosamine N-acyltransferase [Tepidimonas sp.]MDW8335355.1 UDP-3-O-(3-hydroxymyristoyl)glucosamine N-acyltransferase [Tepidimonas sp.]
MASAPAASRTAAPSGVTLAELAQALGGQPQGASQRQVHRIAPLPDADETALSFVAHARYRPQLAASRAGVVIVPPELAQAALARPAPPDGGWAAWVTPDPYALLAALTRWWRAHRQPRPAPQGVHPTAWIAPGARVHPTARIGPFAVVEEGAEIGAGAELGAHAVVQAGARVGPGTRLGPHVVLGYDCCIGARGLVHGGTVIGADGFGFAPVPLPDGSGRRWDKIEQLGAVVIGDDVEIGANCCIDRGALGDTVLQDGVKLDNLIQIGHNVRVGRHTAMAGCVGVAGSARIGAFCTLGGGAIVLGHLELADHVHISAASVVMRSILQPGQYSGIFPIDDNRAWEKNAATLRQLHALRERLKALERRMTT